MGTCFGLGPSRRADGAGGEMEAAQSQRLGPGSLPPLDQPLLACHDAILASEDKSGNESEGTP
jgi:hypothetical protein